MFQPPRSVPESSSRGRCLPSCPFDPCDLAHCDLDCVWYNQPGFFSLACASPFEQFRKAVLSPDPGMADVRGRRAEPVFRPFRVMSWGLDHANRRARGHHTSCRELPSSGGWATSACDVLESARKYRPLLDHPAGSPVSNWMTFRTGDDSGIVVFHHGQAGTSRPTTSDRTAPSRGPLACPVIGARLRS
ncbi:hypothetical protein J2S92_004058 [Arthrobacter bambusae]|nr:hypothetical protein [Arthrobacter bambusae]MDQ0237654.1 hypothetical protein [Arthrobacter bambusae]